MFLRMKLNLRMDLDAVVSILTVDLQEERRRHIERNDSQNDTWLQGRRSQIDNIQKNFNLMGHINVVANNDIETSLNIQDEIYGKII